MRIAIITNMPLAGFLNKPFIFPPTVTLKPSLLALLETVYVKICTCRLNETKLKFN